MRIKLALALLLATSSSVAQGDASTAAVRKIALTNATLIDGTGAPPQAGRTVIVENGRIADIHPSDGRPIPEGTTVIDLAGLTLMPGLIDSHVHFNLNDSNPPGSPGGREDVALRREQDLRTLLRSGVTTVRELAGDTRITAALKQRVEQGELEGPAITFAAVFFGPRFLEDARSSTSARGLQPGTAPWSRLVTPELDIARAMEEARATGATGVKLYASLSADQLRALSREAQRQGLLVWSHSVIFPSGAVEALTAGADSLIHSKGMVTVAGLQDIPEDFEAGTRKWMMSRNFAAIDPEGPAFQAFYAEMVRRGTILEPALMADGDLAPQPLPPPRAAMRDWACRATGAAHRAGVPISAGTDSVNWKAGILQRELARLVECGLSPLQAIHSATEINARALGISGTHGTVAIGKAADLIAVAGDPAQDIAATNAVRMVMQGGRLVVRPERS